MITTQFKGAQVSFTVAFNTRNIALTTLGEAQRLLSSHEGSAQFKATTIIALIAVLISVVSVVK